MVNFLNVYGPGLAILCIVFFEAAGVFWFYGVDNFSTDVESMIGHKPGLFWRICWMYISPVFLLVIFIFSLMGYEEMLGDEYEYPEWSYALGWVLTLSSILCVPIYVIYKILITPGSIKYVSYIKILIKTYLKSRIFRIDKFIRKYRSELNRICVFFLLFQRIIKSFKPEESQPTAIPGQILCSGTTV